MSANNKQVGGKHYSKYGDLQPWDVVIQWELGYLEGTALTVSYTHLTLPTIYSV